MEAARHCARTMLVIRVTIAIIADATMTLTTIALSQITLTDTHAMMSSHSMT
jgi:hypothetical protein